MGRKKIVIKRLTEDRNRNVTFLKRKHGLLKKAWELSVLCGAEVSILIFSHHGKCFEFSSADSLDKAIERYHDYSGLIERRRAPEYAQMAESGMKDDEDDLDEEELLEKDQPQGSSSKGISLKGKEDWKEVTSSVRMRNPPPGPSHSGGNAGTANGRGRVRASSPSGADHMQGRDPNRRATTWVPPQIPRDAHLMEGKDERRQMEEAERLAYGHQPIRQPSMASLYPSTRMDLPRAYTDSRVETSHMDPSSFRSDPRYNNASYDMQAPPLHPTGVQPPMGGPYAEYTLPVDNGINADGTIDWQRAAAAAQIQAALHTQQAQLSYMYSQRRQQEHWRELLAASQGGGNANNQYDMSNIGAGVSNAAQRYNALISSNGQDFNPAIQNGGSFEWPTMNPINNNSEDNDSLHSSQAPPNVAPGTGEWYSESVRSSAIVPPELGPRGTETNSNSSLAPSPSHQSTGSGRLDNNSDRKTKRNWTDTFDDRENPKRAKSEVDSGAGTGSLRTAI